MPPDDPRKAPVRPKARPAATRPGASPGRGGPGPAPRPGARPARRPGAPGAAGSRDPGRNALVTGAIFAVLGAIVLMVVRTLAVQHDKPAAEAAAPANHSPEIQTLELVLSRSNVVARAQGHDIDGHRFRYQYRWTVGGQLQRARGASLSRNLVSPGQTVEVEATPVDRLGASGRPMRSSLTLDFAKP